MKKIISIIALFASTAAFAQLPYVADLIGTWTVVETVCNDGQAPRLPFNPTRDSLELTYDGVNFTSVASVAGFSRSLSGTYTVSKNLISMTEKMTGQTQKLGYFITKQDELILIESGMACSDNKALLITHKRK